MVQIQPVRSNRRAHETELALEFTRSLFRRPDLNNPPTSVGGIQESRFVLACRWNLNHPPTSVSGIREFSHRLGVNKSLINLRFDFEEASLEKSTFALIGDQRERSRVALRRFRSGTHSAQQIGTRSM